MKPDALEQPGHPPLETSMMPRQSGIQPIGSKNGLLFHSLLSSQHRPSMKQLTTITELLSNSCYFFATMSKGH